MKLLWILLAGTAAIKVRLSNTALPLDTNGRELLTGEASSLKVGKWFYFYFNNWGSCSGNNTCATEAGCFSCASRVSSNCIYAVQHVVNAYKTQDFKEWIDLGVVLPISARAPGYLFRPHVVYNAQTDRFVMWFEDHSVNASIHGLYHVADSSAPEGPFMIVAENVSMPFAGYPVMHVGDFDIFVDTDGEAYHVRTGFSVVRLNANYTAPLEVVSTFTTPRTSEAPTMFRRGDTYHILAGSSCCACLGGSNLYTFTAASPRGPWTLHGDVGSNVSAHTFDIHSRWNYVTRAQASAVFRVPTAGGGEEFVWVGNQWMTGDTRNHDLLYWARLEFDSTTGAVDQLKYHASAEFELAGSGSMREESGAFAPPPVTPKVYNHFQSQFTNGHAMFMHFGVSTFYTKEGHSARPSDLSIPNECWHGSTVKPSPAHPCLSPKLFNPSNLSAPQWMRVAKQFGADEICITAHHEGGFALWPTNQSSYSVANSAWKHGKGDVLREFAAAARDAGIKICYYIGPNSNGWFMQRNYSAEEFIKRQLGMFEELLTEPAYGPVHRLWIDHPWQPCHNYTSGVPPPVNPKYTSCPASNAEGKPPFPLAQLQFDALVTRVSPSTIMGGSELWNGPTTPQYPNWYYCNLSDPLISHSGCGSVNDTAHGIDSTDAHGQYGVSYRPLELTESAIGGWFGTKGDTVRANATQLWQSWMASVGVGGGWILNLPPTTTGQIPESWAAPAIQFGAALRASFSTPVRTVLSPQYNATVQCGRNAPALVIGWTIPVTFNAVRSAEDVYHSGQVVSRYTIEAYVFPQPPRPASPLWVNVTARGRSVGLGTIDMMATGNVTATHLRWRCLAATSPSVVLSTIELYVAKPPA
jgi:hypothetical protein